MATAELSKLEGMELVERDQLDQVTRELALSSALEPRASATRLKMGQLLKADALLLLSIENIAGRPVLKLVVSDSQVGARLHIEQLLYHADARTALASHCAQSVAKVREQFAGGVRQVIAVSPFLSKDLLHDFDYLQVSCTRLVEVGLTSLPQVAVVEIEEAKAIGRELLLTNTPLKDRPTPYLVEGEYTVARGSAKGPVIQFDVSRRGVGVKQYHIRPAALTLTDAARFLVRDLPKQIVQQNDGPGEPAFLGEQARWLTERAAAFAQIGAWQQETELLEAALLLSPDDLGLRMKLLAAYYDYVSSYGRWLSGSSGPDFRAGLPKLIDAYLSCLKGVDYLIRNQCIDRWQATSAVCSTPQFQFWANYHRALALGGSDLAFRGAFQPVIDAEEKFLSEAYPLIRQLPERLPGEREVPKQLVAGWMTRTADFEALWLQELADWLIAESDRAWTLHNLDFQFRLLTQVIPDRFGTPENLWTLLHTTVQRGYDTYERASDRAVEVDSVAFLRQLAESKHRMASLWGRYGLLTWRFYVYLAMPKPQSKEMEAGESLLADMDAWLTDYGAMAKTAPARHSRQPERIYSDLMASRTSLDSRLHPQPLAAARPRPVMPTVPRKAENAAGTLKLEEIELRGFTSDGFQHLLTCGKDCDVFWQEHAVAIVRRRGAAKEIVEYDTMFRSLHWDGWQVWLTTPNQAIGVLSLDGKMLGIGTSEGLPPSDHGLSLHVVSQGKVCVAGCFGEHHRAWCAMVELGDNKPKVNVFLRATHVLPPATPHGKDLEEAFQPGSFLDYDLDKGVPRSLLLSRGSGSPLLINLSTLEVSALDAPHFQVDVPTDRFTNAKGEILGIGGGRVTQLRPPVQSSTTGLLRAR